MDEKMTVDISMVKARYIHAITDAPDHEDIEKSFADIPALISALEAMTAERDEWKSKLEYREAHTIPIMEAVTAGHRADITRLTLTLKTEKAKVAVLESELLAVTQAAKDERDMWKTKFEKVKNDLLTLHGTTAGSLLEQIRFTEKELDEWIEKARQAELYKEQLSAAVIDLMKHRKNKCDCCYYCGKTQRFPCSDCQSPISNFGDGWKWRGAQPQGDVSDTNVGNTESKQGSSNAVWIEAEDHLPNDIGSKNLIIIDNEDNDVLVATYEGEGHWDDEEAYRQEGEITHWMPLPELPTKQGNMKCGFNDGGAE